MFIHNYYIDILYSVRTLFDSHIFPVSNYIKRYEFNLGNRNIQLGKDYEQKFSFPNVIASIGSSQSAFGGMRTESIMRLRADNVNQIPVLYNSTTKQYLYVQEEITTIPLDIQINCESSLQAMEVEHTIKYYLPMNKYLQAFAFTSFFEIDPVYLNDNDFVPTEHDIINLFTKVQKSLVKEKEDQSTEVYCYSLAFKPMIRLESISTGVNDSGQRSFPVNVSMTYMIHVPVFIFNEKDANIDRIAISFDRFYYEPIIDYPMKKILDDSSTDDNTYVKRNILYCDNSAPFVIESDDLVTFVCKFDPEGDFKINIDYTYYLFDVRGNIHKEFEPTDVDPLSNTVTFIFSKETWDQYFNFSVTSPIILQIRYLKT